MALSGTRTDQEWLQDLRAGGEAHESALSDLGEVLRRGLPYALTGWLDRDDPRLPALVEETVQEALLRILDRLDTFEGRSRLTTWANKIALRIALTELRRQRWKDVSLDSLVDAGGAGVLGGAPEATERTAGQSEALYLVGRMLDEELTGRQRDALTAVAIHGVAMEVVADRMGMNRNALYKLLHDARLRLKRRLAREGLSPQDVLALFGPR
jgi:RNA polymerase sigma-70 factor (ECF subfamily)